MHLKRYLLRTVQWCKVTHSGQVQRHLTYPNSAKSGCRRGSRSCTLKCVWHESRSDCAPEHAQTHARTHTHTRAGTHTHTRAGTHTHTHTHTHARTYTHAHTCAHAHTHTRTHTRTHAHARTRTHARTHAHTHSHYTESWKGSGEKNEFDSESTQLRRAPGTMKCK